jgi:phosphatidylinositol glycan class P protein
MDLEDIIITDATTPSSHSVYSFVGWIASFGVYFCFLVWAFLPEEFLHSIGITYYPSKYYAIALPAYCIVVYLLIGIFYTGYNMMNTLDPEDYGTFRDEGNTQKFIAPVSIRCGAKDGIPEIGDIDILNISKIIN